MAWPSSRRVVLQSSALAVAGWLSPVSQVLARRAEQIPGHEPAQSVILLWLAGGPSQLETFDPHPGAKIAGDTKAIATAVPGIQLAGGLERLADEMQSVSLVRSLVSKEGDHERGTYLAKDRLPARSDDRASVDRRHLLPQAARRPDGDSAAHFDLAQPMARPGRIPGQSSTTPSKRLIRPRTVARRRRASLRRAASRERLDDLRGARRAFARGRRRPSGTATLHRDKIQRGAGR